MPFPSSLKKPLQDRPKTQLNVLLLDNFVRCDHEEHFHAKVDEADEFISQDKLPVYDIPRSNTSHLSHINPLFPLSLY